MTLLTFYKILRKDLLHNGFKYRLGLNIDSNPFSISVPCSPGGLYFTELRHLHYYADYGELVGEIEIPPDAQIYEEPGDATKWKADKIFLKSIVPMRDFFATHVDKNYNFLEFIPPTAKTFEMCQTAIRKNPLLFRYVPQKFRTAEMIQFVCRYCPGILPPEGGKIFTKTQP
jgi:hypothetical protein